MKILLLALIFGVTGWGCSTGAKKPAPLTSNCVKGAGAQAGLKTRAQIQETVVEGLKSGAGEALLKYASCDFLVGPPESDAAGYVAPAKALPSLVQLSKDIEWAKQGKDYGEQYNLPAEKSLVVHELIFRRDPKLGWHWSGFATADKELLGALMKYSYGLDEEQYPAME